MNAIDTLGPETASDERQSHIHETQMKHPDRQWIESLQQNLEQKQIRKIHAAALEAALSIQPRAFHEFRRKALCHAIAALSAEYLWRHSKHRRYVAIVSRELKQATRFVQQMNAHLQRNERGALLYENLVEGTIFGSAVTRHLLCLIPEQERQAALKPTREYLEMLLDKDDKKGKALLYCELAESALALGDEEKAQEFAEAAVIFSGRYFRQMEKLGNLSEGAIWKTKTWSIAARFNIKITSKK